MNATHLPQRHERPHDTTRSMQPRPRFPALTEVHGSGEILKQAGLDPSTQHTDRATRFGAHSTYSGFVDVSHIQV
ncbi:hypothetical protein YWIDRAFT_07417 [Streptomyces sp. SceaMP-e96]|nr:hypothetical protein YWIDRAFT_07417 [Streptomyces sp. SceaMP-e96]